MAKITSKHPRPELTDEELTTLRSDDLIRLKLSTSEISRLKQINNQRAKIRQERVDRIISEQKPIIEDLQNSGVNVELLGNLITDKQDSMIVSKILLKHLLLPYSDITKETIARALGRSECKISGSWELIIDEYKNAREGSGIQGPGDTEESPLGAKLGLASAITCLVSDEKILEVINLLKDDSNGKSRIILLTSLFESKSPLAEKALLELSSDPVLENEIARWRKRR